MTESRHAKQFLFRCKTEFSTAVHLLGFAVSRDVGRTRLEFLQRNIERASGTALIDESTGKELVDTIKEALSVQSMDPISLDDQGSAYTAPRSSGGQVGRPACVISREQLLFFADSAFSAGQMADMLHVSERTVKRRLSDFEIKLRNFSDIPDDELQREISHLTHQNHLMGPNAVRARLFGKGIKVQRWRVRDVMLRMDPAGAALRGLIKKPYRRTYRVAGPNSLWHVDGNHKLIRWNMVIHGGIDGFSRMIVFIKIGDNNTAATVLSHFIDAGNLFGFPSRVRCDDGGENNDMCALMEVLHGEGRGSVIRGASVHNQRIERAWVDVWKDVTNIYYELFYYLEDKDLLDIGNMIDLFSLHFIYFPRIGKDLFNFQRQWNHHGLRTENSQSPIQLFISKSLALFDSSYTAMNDLFPTPTTPSTGESSSTASNETLVDPSSDPHTQETLQWESQIVVPRIVCPLAAEHMEELKRQVDPLDSSFDTYGMALYLQTRSFILAHM